MFKIDEGYLCCFNCRRTALLGHRKISYIVRQNLQVLVLHAVILLGVVRVFSTYLPLRQIIRNVKSLSHSWSVQIRSWSISIYAWRGNSQLFLWRRGNFLQRYWRPDVSLQQKQVRLVSVEAERPLGGGQPARGGGVLHDNDAHVTPLGRFDLQSRSA